jgi:hypothetical protein
VDDAEDADEDADEEDRDEDEDKAVRVQGVRDITITYYQQCLKTSMTRASQYCRTRIWLALTLSAVKKASSNILHLTSQASFAAQSFFCWDTHAFDPGRTARPCSWSG